MLPTPLELVRLSAEYLGGKGVENPRLDAEVLLAHVLGVPRIQLYVQYDRPLEAGEVDAYREAVRRRARREPVAHITGQREFWSLDLAVGPRVLIPRPETEVLVEACLARLGEAGRFLDLGVGSGAVSLALLSERSGWSGVAVDRSPEAAEVARGNAARHGLAERLQVCVGDLFEAVGDEPFDAVISNPPYVPSGDLEGLAPEVAWHEPREALDGGPDGLGVIRRILRDAPSHLRPAGLLALEFGAGQEGAVAGACREAGAYGEPEIVPDYAGRSRVLVTERR